LWWPVCFFSPWSAVAEEEVSLGAAPLLSGAALLLSEAAGGDAGADWSCARAGKPAARRTARDTLLSQYFMFSILFVAVSDKTPSGTS
jgi:hypothetical protein